MNQRKFSTWDAVSLSCVTALAGVTRAAHISSLPFIYSDETFYAREACNFVHQSPAVCGIPIDAISGHPPFGKWLISLGIRAFGFEPFGWRIASVVAGTLTVALLFLLAHRVLASTWAASLTAGLLAIDFLHTAQSRIAMLDVFLTLFVVATALFVVLDRDAPHRRWLMAAGAAAGAAIATKWIGAPALLLAIAIGLMWMRSRNTTASGRIRVTRRDLVTLCVAFVLVPGVVYVVSYAGRIQGSVFSAPWARGSWVRNFAHTQREMLTSHSSGTEVHYVGLTNPYVSPAWTWPLIKRPMSYYAEERATVGHQRVMAGASPLVWWTSFAALASLAYALARRRRNDAAIVAVVGFAFLYVPFVLVSAVRTATFFYYMLPSVPFMCLAVGTAVDQSRHRFTRVGSVLFGTCALALFAFFYPVLTAQPITQAEDARRIWFHDCAPAAGRRAPGGWCWE